MDPGELAFFWNAFNRPWERPAFQPPPPCQSDCLELGLPSWMGPALEVASILPPIRALRVPGLLRAAIAGPSSRALGRALRAAGHQQPLGSAAHHIVAGKAGAADPARTVLQRFGIGINDAANGVFLPSGVHAHIHTNRYYQTVNQMLGAATTRAEAEAALNAIRQALLTGGL